MTPTDPLAPLNPLRQPEAISWWPLAPGWWILIAMALIGLGVLGWLLLQRYRRAAYRRDAASALEQAEARWTEEQDDLLYLQQVNRTLKIVATRSYGGDVVAGLSGAAWVDFLRQHCAAAALPDALADGPYRPTIQDQPLAGLGSAARQWVMQHEVNS